MDKLIIGKGQLDPLWGEVAAGFNIGSAFFHGGESKARLTVDPFQLLARESWTPS
jgi:hypothetical protein